ncbi:MAG: radical SAM protein [Lachnospiraceae bacterium]|nr:radical SAM protein [Lachnospiraceae bacterium]
MDRCNLCPRQCNVDRNVNIGYCKVGAEFKIGRIMKHMWEEPCISGDNGSGAVFFSGCNMGCIYCQNDLLSKGLVGKDYTEDELIIEMLKLQDMGCNNINLVTPTHYSDRLIDVIKSAKSKGLMLPIVYNTSSYEKVESLKALEGLIDIYLPDLKYLDIKGAKNYSNAEDYPEVARLAIDEMVRQVGGCEFNEDGVMKKGVIVRHLVLPGRIGEGKKVIEYLYNRYGDMIYISIMNQYTPYGKAKNDALLCRPITEEEYDEVVNYAISLGVENGFIQEGETCDESFIPEFTSE